MQIIACLTSCKRSVKLMDIMQITCDLKFPIFYDVNVNFIKIFSKYINNDTGCTAQSAYNNYKLFFIYLDLILLCNRNLF